MVLDYEFILKIYRTQAIHFQVIHPILRVIYISRKSIMHLKM